MNETKPKGFFDNGVPVDVKVSLNTMDFVYLGGTIVFSIVLGTILTRLLPKLK